MAILRVFVLVACSFALAAGHSTGADPAACKTMIPGHGDTATNIQGGSAPYQLVAPGRVQAGATTTISLGGAPLLGFMVRVLDARGDSKGRFGSAPNSRPMQCQVADDTATHTRLGGPINSVDLSWQAPSEPGVYRVMATIVKEYSTYYTGYFTDITVV